MNTLMLFFVWLVGLGLIISTVALFRDYGQRGLLALVSGAGLLVAAVFWLPPLLAEPGKDPQVDSLRAELAKAQTQASDAARDVVAVTSKLEVESKARTSAEIALNESLTAIGQDVDKLQLQYSEPESAIYLDTATISAASASQAEPPERIERIRNTLDAMRQLKTRTAFSPVQQDSTPSMNDTRELMGLKDKMSTRLETKTYDVELYPDKELVGGRQGKYYVIDLKEAANGIRYYFEGGKYSLARGSAEFRSSLNTFIGDVLKKMEGKVRYDLFVRGSADSKPYQGRMEQGLSYQKIALLRHAGDNRYDSQPSELQLSSTVQNEDLPNLRAAFMRDVVAENYPVKRPVILEGSVSPQSSDKDRNVELILFVDW